MKETTTKKCFHWINLFKGDNERHKSNILVTHLIVMTIQLSSYTKKSLSIITLLQSKEKINFEQLKVEKIIEEQNTLRALKRRKSCVLFWKRGYKYYQHKHKINDVSNWKWKIVAISQNRIAFCDSTLIKIWEMALPYRDKPNKIIKEEAITLLLYIYFIILINNILK